MKRQLGTAAVVTAGLLAGGCGDSDHAPDLVYHLADACMEVVEAPGGEGARALGAPGDGSFAFGEAGGAARFHLKASDLGTYLFYDEERHYLGSDGEHLLREGFIQSDVTTVDDSYDPGVEWAVEAVDDEGERVRLRHLASGEYLGSDGLVPGPRRAVQVSLVPTTGCTEYPELTLDAEGEVQRTEFEDGSVFGIVDTHSHILTNFSFGGGGIFHGAPFHPLGVEHALPDCELYHGFEGRSDLLGFGFDHGGSRGDGLSEEVLIEGLLSGEAPEFNHHTAGYPHFTDWPNAHFSSTHQVQYYKWLERAYLGGLRLVVQHATSNQVICDLMAGSGTQDVRYSCNDMVAVDRILEETYAMERYIDAQEGGPGRGWFRIVTSPEEAREVIRGGKMAVVLGIEVSNLFDCFLVPSVDDPVCDEAFVQDQLDHYHELGVRAIFPVHKFDNAFSAGDGDRVIMELANVIQTGHYLNFVSECPDTHAVFDRGDVAFGNLNEPRDDYFGEPAFDMSGFGDDPVNTLLPFAGYLLDAEPLEGDHCQNAGLQPLGAFLMEELMHRGMIIEIDHLPRRGYADAMQILEAHDYPAAATHGSNAYGDLYALGGVSKTGLGRCRDPNQGGTMADGLRARVDLIRDHGGFPAEGFGFDFNGFAGAPGPRLGEHSVCSEQQTDPLTYPFTSYAGDVTFHQPQAGHRTFDFNTEGMAHIGLMPELIEDARRDGVSDEDLEPLFKSAEGYLRMWERARQRAESLREGS